jgi:hypothetical protein
MACLVKHRANFTFHLTNLLKTEKRTVRIATDCLLRDPGSISQGSRDSLAYSPDPGAYTASY